MPIYEYRCESCGHELEQLQRMSDAPLRTCPACGKPALKRLISAAGFRLKGGGWYETDFKQSNKRNIADSGEGAKADKPAGEKTEKPAAAKSDAAGSAKAASSSGDKAGTP